MIVYLVTNRVNGKVYVGQISCVGKTLAKRWREHQLYPANSHFASALKKYGVANFETTVLYEAKMVQELNAMETFFIVLYQSHKPENGYNQAISGGAPMLGRKHSMETRGKISASHLASNKDSILRKQEWQVEGRKEAARQRKLGTTQSQTVRDKISEANTGFKFDQIQIENMRKAWTPERRSVQAIRMKEMRKGAAASA